MGGTNSVHEQDEQNENKHVSMTADEETCAAVMHIQQWLATEQGSDAEARGLATMLYLIKQQEVRPLMLREGCCEKAVVCFHAQTVRIDIKCDALGLLVNIATHEANKIPMILDTCVMTLVKSQAASQNNAPFDLIALRVLANLARNDVASAVLFNDPDIFPLAMHLASAGVMKAWDLLRNLAGSPDNIERMYTDAEFMRLVKSEMAQGNPDATCVLRNLARDSVMCHKVFVDHQDIVQMAKSECDNDSPSPAMMDLLWCFAINEENAFIMGEDRALVDMMKSHASRGEIAALSILCHLAGHPMHSSLMWKDKELVGIAKTQARQGSKDGLWILRNMSLAEENQAQMFQDKEIVDLAKYIIMTCDDDDTRGLAFSMLRHLASHYENKIPMCEDLEIVKLAKTHAKLGSVIALVLLHSLTLHPYNCVRLFQDEDLVHMVKDVIRTAWISLDFLTKSSTHEANMDPMLQGADELKLAESETTRRKHVETTAVALALLTNLAVNDQNRAIMVADMELLDIAKRGIIDGFPEAITFMTSLVCGSNAVDIASDAKVTGSALQSINKAPLYVLGLFRTLALWQDAARLLCKPPIVQIVSACANDGNEEVRIVARTFLSSIGAKAD